jgi:hypothetical protein
MENRLDLETFLAAAIHSCGGEIRINKESIEDLDFKSLLIGIALDAEKEQVVLTLEDKDTVEYDDNDPDSGSEYNGKHASGSDAST